MVDGRDDHAGHDPNEIAGLLDRDLAPTGRAALEARLARCSACADLHADLITLARAIQVQPAPGRSRSFLLTPADAERLRASGREEPSPDAARLTREMTDSRTSRAHATHDPLLIAALADRTVTSTERQAAETLVATCVACAELHADLAAIRLATRSMAVPSRPRAYTLSPGDADRLGAGGWRRWVAAFGTSRDLISRPLAMGLTTLGVVGLLVSTIPAISLGGATSGAAPVEQAAAPESNGPASAFGAGDAASTAAPADPDGVKDPSAAALGTTSGPSPSFAGTTDTTGEGATSQVPAPAAGNPEATESLKGAAVPSNDSGRLLAREQALTDETQAGPSMLVVISVVFLAVGLGLLGVRRSARSLVRS